MGPSWGRLGAVLGRLGANLASQKPPKIDPKLIKNRSKNRCLKGSVLGGLRGAFLMEKPQRKSKKKTCFNIEREARFIGNPCGTSWHVFMHLRAGGGRQSDPHLYASSGGRRAAHRTTSLCICGRAAGGQTTHIPIHVRTGGHLKVMLGPSWAILRGMEPS